MSETLYFLEYYDDFVKIRKLHSNMLFSQIKNTDINCTKHNTYNKRRSSGIEFDEWKLIIWHFNLLNTSFM